MLLFFCFELMSIYAVMRKSTFSQMCYCFHRHCFRFIPSALFMLAVELSSRVHQKREFKCLNLHHYKPECN